MVVSGPVEIALLTRQSQGLFLEVLAEPEASPHQLVQQRFEPREKPHAFCTYENAHRAYDSEVHAKRYVTGFPVVQDDSHLLLCSEGNRLGLAAIDCDAQGSDELSLRWGFNPQPIGGRSKFPLDFGRSEKGLEESRKQLKTSYLFETDQAGAVEDGRLLQKSTSVLNSSGL